MKATEVLKQAARVFVSRGEVIVALIAVAWLAIGVDVMLALTFPWPTAVVNAAGVGFVAGGLFFGERRRAAVEPVYVRKDAAVEGAMAVAWSAQQLEQRLSGETPAVELFDQDAEPVLLGEDDDTLCAICSAVSLWVDCAPCGGRGDYEPEWPEDYSGDTCGQCDGAGGWWHCTNGACVGVPTVEPVHSGGST